MIKLVYQTRIYAAVFKIIVLGVDLDTVSRQPVDRVSCSGSGLRERREKDVGETAFGRTPELHSCSENYYKGMAIQWVRLLYYKL